ncbi:MAG: right-handed parallel beta-helix repeat-containing protein [Bacteroidota bacterium]
MKKIYLTILCVVTTVLSFARYTTPGTGVKWTLDDLVANSAGKFTYGDFYQANDTIFINLLDTLTVTNDATVKFAASTYFDVNGVIIVNPPTGVTFTALNTVSGYLGMRLDSTSNSLLKKLTFEYAVALRIADCSPLIDSCIFRYNNNSVSTSFGSSAIFLTRSNATISNSQFLDNGRAAIAGGFNIANAPKIINNLFRGNDTQNINTPQINMSATGNDTMRIINNRLLRASTNCGGIGFLSSATTNVVITGNLVINNRYGITFNGGANINALVSYNVLDSNNTDGNPLTGGSGIAFSGGTASSHQNVIVTGNLFRWNLWGVTVGPTSTGGGAKPNLGNITNADTTDDGKNQFVGNNNANTPRIDLYNNNVDSIYAQNNSWGSDNADTAEARIFHKNDNAALGIVIYSPLLTPLPVTLLSFNAIAEKNNVLLEWKTATENNSSHFEIESSSDGRNFYLVGRINAAGTSILQRSYQFRDVNALQSGALVYYRLKQVDKDGAAIYSKVVAVKSGAANLKFVKLYPTLISETQKLQAEVFSSGSQHLLVQWYDGQGKLLAQTNTNLNAGNNIIPLPVSTALPSGPLYIQFAGEHFTETMKVVKQ